MTYIGPNCQTASDRLHSSYSLILILLAAVPSAAFGQTALSTAQIAKRVSPSVVVIHGKTDSGDVLGSGFIISKDGRIVTNLHVIMETRTATVQLANGEIYDSVSVLATDERRDLAILRVPGFNLPVLEMGDSDSLTIGEPVVILGTPRGLEGTVTAGILSSVRDSGEGFKVLQTDAAVNPGNSGGPLLNKKGQAIGVVSFKLRSSENLNFAVPINYVRGLLTTLHEPMPLELVRTQLRETPTPKQKSSTPPQSEVFTELSPGQVRSILKGMGFEFTESASDKLLTFRFQLNGYKAALFDYGSNIQLYQKFSDKIDPGRANEWNRQYRYSRAYSDKDGGAVIEADLDFEGGVTRATVEEFIKTFRSLLDPWVEFVSNAGTPTTSSPSTPTYTKSPSAKKRVPMPFGKFALWVDADKWKATKSDEGGVLTFENINGEGYAKIITGRISLPTDVLKDAALANMRAKDPNAKITFEENRIVNGHHVLVLQFDVTYQRIPWRFYGYYHGGTSGTIQAITYTAASAFDDNLKPFTEFLNGLEIMDEELPLPEPSSPTTDSSTQNDGLLLFNSAKMNLTYDPKKWKRTPSDEIGRYTFEHKNGDGYAMVIAERLSVPTDSLPDVALSNAKESDPNAKIISKEKRSVGGVDVWFLKLAADLNRIPIIYYGYYYSGKAGTVQVLTYTGANLIAEYDKDFFEYLNGLRILQ